MEPFELLRIVALEFEKLELRYLVTGSMATILYGEPRFTNDIDALVDLAPGKIHALCRAFPPPEFYVSEDAVREAIAGHSQFNIIHPTSGLKVDVIIPDRSDFNRERFARAVRISPTGEYSAVFASAEDIIISKVAFYREGGSEKHLRDIAGVLKISGDKLDRQYIEDWLKKLELEEIWRLVEGRVEGK